jgi:putative ABC transport system permease protein
VAVDENGQLQVIQSELENRIYTTNNSINTINEQVSEAEMQANGTNVSYNFNNIMPTFVLKDPEALQAFKEEALPKLPKYFRFTDNSAQFKNISTPMKNMDWISGIVLYVAVGATVLILSLLVTLFLRDRRHEMGIYLSLGERKFKVAAQIVIEVMAIAVIAVSLSLFSGNIAAKNMSGKMLENQIIAEQQNNTDNPGKVFPGGMGGSNYAISSQELMDYYNVNLGTDTVLFIYLIGIGTIFISTLVPIFYTLRLNPKKILM